MTLQSGRETSTSFSPLSETAIGGCDSDCLGDRFSLRRRRSRVPDLGGRPVDQCLQGT